MQDFTPDFNYMIFLIIKGDSVFMEDWVVNPYILVMIQSFQVRGLPSVITWNYQYPLNYGNIENLA